MVSSNRTSCELHNFRIHLANHLSKTNIVDCFGTFNGGPRIKIAESLTSYRYSIAVENSISPYWFTEKILNCFASMTIPIYFGASDIGRFFNTDGIVSLSVDDPETVEKALKVCTRDEYIARLPAILDNFQRVQRYLCIEDYLYINYESLLFTY